MHSDGPETAAQPYSIRAQNIRGPTHPADPIKLLEREFHFGLTDATGCGDGDCSAMETRPAAADSTLAELPSGDGSIDAGPGFASVSMDSIG